ncbi:MAG: hypothetical protein D6824_00365 [Planctomycetota bacterium]|nr:MAG: hypothetical protein D6824_00365 [Planctomycetota bacterium]
MSDGAGFGAATLWTQVRAYLGVTLATVVIWLFAEVQGLDEEQVETEIRLVSTPGSALRLRAVDPDAWTGVVKLQLRGSRGALSLVKRRLAAGVELSPDHPAVPTTPGVHVLDVAKDLARDPAIAQAGVQIVAAEPPRLSLRVVRLVRREVDVALQLPPDVRIVGEPTVSPTRALLTAPASMLAQMEAENQPLRVLAAPTKAALEDLPAGRPQTITVRLRPPPALQQDPDVAIEPAAAALTLTMQSRLETVKVAPAPIWVALPPTEVGRWKAPLLEGEPFLDEVIVRGDESWIQRIRQREVGVVAVAALSSDDLERRVSEKAIRFALLVDGELTPPPPTLVFEAPVQRVKLRIEPRPAGEPGGPPAAPNQAHQPTPQAAAL